MILERNMQNDGKMLLLLVSLAMSIGNSVRAAELTSNSDKDASAKLPVSEIILYSSGVGYFQRDGEVEGKAAVALHFKVEDINDLLKSMVVQDRDGGREM